MTLRTAPSALSSAGGPVQVDREPRHGQPALDSRAAVSGLSGEVGTNCMCTNGGGIFHERTMLRAPDWLAEQPARTLGTPLMRPPAAGLTCRSIGASARTSLRCPRKRPPTEAALLFLFGMKRGLLGLLLRN